MGLEQFKKPIVKILYNGVDKTSLMDWISINIEDNESDEADKLNITLGWSNARPREKDKLEIYINDDFLGEFIISSINYNYKKSFEIEAISANFYEGFKKKKNRTFDALSYTQILQSIAKENGYNIKIDFDRMNEMVTLEQYNISDCAFCKKIADDLQITFCVKNNTLIFIDRDKDFKRVEYTLNEDEIISLSYGYNYTKVYNCVEVKWLDVMGNKEGVAKTGNGTPVFVCSDFAINEAEAIRKANAQLKLHKSNTFNAKVQTHGVNFFAGGKINLVLNDEPKQLKGIIKKISHKIDANNWLSDIEFF